MPRYFFDIHDGDRDHDEVGVEIANVDLARAEAIKFAGAYVRNDPSLLDHGLPLYVQMLDEQRTPQFRITIHIEDLRTGASP